jgi:hypothetical protein
MVDASSAGGARVAPHGLEISVVSWWPGHSPHWHQAPIRATLALDAEAGWFVGSGMPMKTSGRIFYLIFLPVAVGINLGLGLMILSFLKPFDWVGWLEIATGAFCCVVAGILGATAWSRSYWARAMSRQIVVWRQMADAIFRWLEEAPLPAEALQRLKRSLDEVVPTSGSS